MVFADLLVIALLAVLVFLVVQGRRKGGMPDVPPVDPDTARLTDEVRELRARIHVLERVITDTHGSADLSSEIERLRDR